MDTEIYIPRFAYVRPWTGRPATHTRPRRLQLYTDVDMMRRGTSYIVARRTLIGQLRAYRKFVSDEYAPERNDWMAATVSDALAAGI